MIYKKKEFSLKSNQCVTVFGHNNIIYFNKQADSLKQYLLNFGGEISPSCIIFS